MHLQINFASCIVKYKQLTGVKVHFMEYKTHFLNIPHTALLLQS
jgi:hypothetical protein